MLITPMSKFLVSLTYCTIVLQLLSLFIDRLSLQVSSAKQFKHRWSQLYKQGWLHLLRSTANRSKMYDSVYGYPKCRGLLTETVTVYYLEAHGAICGSRQSPSRAPPQCLLIHSLQTISIILLRRSASPISCEQSSSKTAWLCYVSCKRLKEQ